MLLLHKLETILFNIEYSCNNKIILFFHSQIIWSFSTFGMFCVILRNLVKSCEIQGNLKKSWEVLGNLGAVDFQ